MAKVRRNKIFEIEERQEKKFIMRNVFFLCLLQKTTTTNITTSAKLDEKKFERRDGEKQKNK